MTGRIRFTPEHGTQFGRLTEVPAFPDDTFVLNVPEAIGDIARAQWYAMVSTNWRELGAGAWEGSATSEGELSFTCEVRPGTGVVDVTTVVTNLSDRTWADALAFNCLAMYDAPSIRDHDCVRHHVEVDGRTRRLSELPRRLSGRPTLQLYHVADRPRPAEIPFVAMFDAAADDLTLGGWMAVVSEDGERLVAASSEQTLFLFQNTEFSCIHASPGHGALAPGETGRATTRYHFVEQRLEDWVRTAV